MPELDELLDKIPEAKEALEALCSVYTEEEAKKLLCMAIQLQVPLSNVTNNAVQRQKEIDDFNKNMPDSPDELS